MMQPVLYLKDILMSPKGRKRIPKNTHCIATILMYYKSAHAPMFHTQGGIVNRTLHRAIVAGGGGTLVGLLVVGALRSSQQKRMQAYYRELLEVLHRAVGRHQGVLEALIALNPPQGDARNLLTEPPTFAVCDAGDLHTDISFTPTYTVPDWLDITISGPVALIRFLEGRLQNDDHGFEVCIDEAQENDGRRELAFSIKVIAEEDQQLREDVRTIVGTT
jgi:hypothetical protein